MQLVQNSTYYTFMLVITNMYGSYEGNKEDLDDFSFEGYLLIKKK